MTSDEEKNPPLPADLENVPKHIHRDQVAEERDRPDPAGTADDPTD